MRALRGERRPLAAILIALVVISLLVFVSAQAQQVQGGVERFRGSLSGK